MMFEYDIPITVVRGSGPDEQRLPMDAIDLGDSYSLPVTADIRDGDRVEQLMPSRVTRTVHITQVKVLQIPGGDDDLDNTQAFLQLRAPPPLPRSPARRRGTSRRLTCRWPPGRTPSRR